VKSAKVDATQISDESATHYVRRSWLVPANEFVRIKNTQTKKEIKRKGKQKIQKVL
jgi:hypothetical protein